MPHFKFVGELHFEAADMNDALAKLGCHFSLLAQAEVSHLLREGSSCALGEPEFDTAIDQIKLVVIGADHVG